MGMGEFLLVYWNVMESIDLIIFFEGLNMFFKWIMVSIVGIVKMIKKLVDDEVKFNLVLFFYVVDDKKWD